MSNLKEVTGRIDHLRSRLREVFEAAGEELDFAKAEVLKLTGAADSKAAVEVVGQWNKELEDLVKREKELRELAEIAKKAVVSEGDSSLVRPPMVGATGLKLTVETDRSPSLGEMIVNSAIFKRFRETREPGKELLPWGLKELKANFVTSAGWPPESLRRPGVVIPPALRPIEVLDVIPTGTTDQAVVKWMDHSTATEAAAERAEAAAYPEETHALTEKSATVRSIGASIPVSDEQLEDVAGVQSYLEATLMNSVRRRLDNQIINGNGVAPNLLGILNLTNIIVRAKGLDPVFDAILKAINDVRTTEYYSPNVIFLNVRDWEKIRLTRTADGLYILGDPSTPGPDTLWGLPVVQTNALAATTAIVGDLSLCMLFERRGVEVEVGYSGTQFTSGLRTIRAGLRVAFAVFREKAFAKVTGI